MMNCHTLNFIILYKLLFNLTIHSPSDPDKGPPEKENKSIIKVGIHAQYIGPPQKILFPVALG